MNKVYLGLVIACILLATIVAGLFAWVSTAPDRVLGEAPIALATATLMLATVAY